MPFTPNNYRTKFSKSIIPNLRSANGSSENEVAIILGVSVLISVLFIELSTL